MKSFKQGTALLVTSQVSQRSGLRKTLFELGIDNKLIEVAGDFEQAKARLAKNPAVNLLVTDDELGNGKKGADLLELHQKNNPISKNRIFIMMSSESSPFLMADYVLNGGDILISKPFTNETFIKTLSAAIAAKEKLSPDELNSLDVQDAVKAKELDKARELLQNFTNPFSIHTLYSTGILNEAIGEMESAFENFKKVITISADFKTLVKLVKVGTFLQKHFELLSYVELWLKKFPLHHSSLLDISRIIIVHKKFELLDEIFSLFARHKVNDAFAKVPLAAGFVMASVHHFESGNEARTREYALKAIEYASKKMNIIYKALEMLVRSGASEEAERAYLKLEFPLVSAEDKVMDIRLKNIVYPKNKIVVDCFKLLSQKIVDPDLYRITVSCMKHIGKDPAEIILQARRAFPELTFDD